MIATLTLLLATVWAEEDAAPAASAPVRVRVAVDDRSAGRLIEPWLEIRQPGVAPVPLRDDGTSDGDVVGDKIYVASAQAAQSEQLRFAVRSSGEIIGTFDVVLPSSGRADFSLKSKEGEPALVMDLAAPPLPDPVDMMDEGIEGGDRIALRVAVDDRAIVRLQQPRLLVDELGAEPVGLVDDGSITGDTANDRIFVADVVVTRSQHVALVVQDRGTRVGRVKVFLPATAEAEVGLVTVDGADGIELMREPSATGATTALAKESGGAGSDRFVHVLWVGIGLFAFGFTYIRSVLYRRWETEVRPLLEALRRFLEHETEE